jgi:hypothetical protein
MEWWLRQQQWQQQHDKPAVLKAEIEMLRIWGVHARLRILDGCHELICCFASAELLGCRTQRAADTDGVPHLAQLPPDGCLRCVLLLIP